eukprot:SAG25_NODE_1153_length_3771_cov_5.694989_6_plen_131_part_00
MMTRSRYEQGDRVEVYSETKQAWMAGMVVAVDGRKIMVQYQERSKIVDLVSGRFHIVVCGRFDWDLPICSACSGHEITEWKRPGQDAPSLGRGFRSALPPALDRHALRASPLTALDVSEVRTLPFIHISP